jgi:hypothetical protein
MFTLSIVAASDEIFVIDTQCQILQELTLFAGY